MNLKEIQNLIRFVAKSGVNEVKLEMKDIKINIRNTAKEKKVLQSTPTVQQVSHGVPVIEAVQAPVVSETADSPATEETNDKYVEITSPIIGTFYRKPSPDKPTFVNIGDEVQSDTVVCIIEAMKLFNEIEAEVRGKIVKVLVDDASPVEFGQPLYLVDPS